MNFADALQTVSVLLEKKSQVVHTEKWQGFDIVNKPEAAMHELTDLFFKVNMPGEDLAVYRDQIKPNLPWADDHFDERVCGEPRNPGNTWLTWPWANKADQSRIYDGKFSHSYMERYWPRFAGISDADFKFRTNGTVNRGIRFEYGDLNDVIDLLHREPHTRQAYLPIFFPEDTGALHGNRVPCTLGYHWIVRDDNINTFYPIRSCDFYRHFRDDLYLTSRLTLWLLDRLREKDPQWNDVKPGTFSMWIGSLHMFRNDYLKLYGASK